VAVLRPSYLCGNLYFFTEIVSLGPAARDLLRAALTFDCPMKLPIVDKMAQQSATSWSLYGAIFVWLIALCAGWAALGYHQFATEPAKFNSVTVWPVDSKLPRLANHSTLVLFLHPKCPCSRATLSELERLFTSIHGRTCGEIDVVVDAPVPQSAGGDWLQTDTLKRAMQLPRSRVMADANGAEAALFGVTTSGFLMLFDQYGARQFSGGITESRGHEGENAGLSNLRSILCNEIQTAVEIPAFGCRLCLPETERTSSGVDRLGTI
jgi:hypothetical protein